MQLIITDHSTNLNETLMFQQNINLINTQTCEIGNIMYELDKVISKGHNVIYLSSSRLFDIIAQISEQIVKMHGFQKIVIVDIESATIGKNNFSLKLSKTTNISKTIKECSAKSKTIYCHEYSNILTKELSKVSF